MSRKVSLNVKFKPIIISIGIYYDVLWVAIHILTIDGKVNEQNFHRKKKEKEKKRKTNRINCDAIFLVHLHLISEFIYEYDFSSRIWTSKPKT